MTLKETEEYVGLLVPCYIQQLQQNFLAWVASQKIPYHNATFWSVRYKFSTFGGNVEDFISNL